MGFGVAQASTTVGSSPRAHCRRPVNGRRRARRPGRAWRGRRARAGRPHRLGGRRADRELGRVDRDHPRPPRRDDHLVVVRDGEEVRSAVTPMLSERYATTRRRGRHGRRRANRSPCRRASSASARRPRRCSSPSRRAADGRREHRQVAGIIMNLPQRIIDVANAAFGPGERDPNGPISRRGRRPSSRRDREPRRDPARVEGRRTHRHARSLNIALFVFNMIPLLPLDGGHIAGALWEAIRRGFAKLFQRPDPGPVDLAKLMPLTSASSCVRRDERAAQLRRHRQAGAAVLWRAAPAVLPGSRASAFVRLIRGGARDTIEECPSPSGADPRLGCPATVGRPRPIPTAPGTFVLLAPVVHQPVRAGARGDRHRRLEPMSARRRVSCRWRWLWARPLVLLASRRSPRPHRRRGRGRSRLADLLLHGRCGAALHRARLRDRARGGTRSRGVGRRVPTVVVWVAALLARLALLGLSWHPFRIAADHFRSSRRASPSAGFVRVRSSAPRRSARRRCVAARRPSSASACASPASCTM